MSFSPTSRRRERREDQIMTPDECGATSPGGWPRTLRRFTERKSASLKDSQRWMPPGSPLTFAEVVEMLERQNYL